MTNDIFLYFLYFHHYLNTCFFFCNKLLLIIETHDKNQSLVLRHGCHRCQGSYTVIFGNILLNIKKIKIEIL